MLGRGHTNQNEASHNVLIRFRPKHSQMTRLHYHVSTNLGLLQSNMTYMNRVRGLGYHWLPDLLQRMGLPLLHGVEAVLMSKGLRCLSIAKLKQLKRRKSSGSLNTGVQTKKKKQKKKRKKWGQSQNFNIHMGMKMTKNLLYPHPLDRPKRGKNLAGVGLPAVAAPPTVTASTIKIREVVWR